MSAFLGPIHYRMFRKALAVDSLARDIAAYADGESWTDGLAAALDAGHPRLQGEIADHIDLSSIHASLNALVGNSESALAAATAPLSEHMADLAAHVREVGASAGKQAEFGTLQQAWNALDESWLDGMPCDGFVKFGDNDDSTVSWSVNLDAHKALGYAQIRAAWLEGFCQGAGLDFSSPEAGSYRISKAA